MKYVCDACERLVEPARAGLGEGGRVELVCPRCQAPSVAVPAAQVALAVPEPERRAEVIPFKGPTLTALPGPEPVVVVPASERCPKCATAKNGRESCAKCGLVFELYRAENDPGLDAMRKEFHAILERWGEAAAREAVDRSGPQRLATLARLCRHHLADYPDDARAKDLLELMQQRSVALAATAVAVSADSRAEAHAAGRRWLAVGVIVMICALGVLAASVLQAHH